MGGKLIKYPIYSTVYLAFVILVVIPIIYTFIATIFEGNQFINNILSLNITTFKLLIKSCAIAASVAILSTISGAILGFLLYKTNIKFSGFFKIALLIPLFISPYILAVAWNDLFYILTNSTSLISSTVGVIAVLTIVFTPLSMLIIGSALSNINAQLEESGLVIANLSKVILKITFPLIKPALISSFILVFIFSISEFSVPAFFGVRVLTTEIFTQFSAFYNHSLAIIQSSLLIVICIILLIAERKYIADAPFLSIGNKGSKNKIYNNKTYNQVGVLYLIGWFSVSIILPFVTLFIQSTKNGSEKIIQAFELLLPTFSSSIILAFIGALLIVIVGFSAAYFSSQHAKTKTSSNFNLILLIVFAIPSVVLGISLIKFYNQPNLSFIYSSYAIILIGYVGRFSFIAAKLIGNSMKQIPISFDEAAQIEGVTYYNRTLKILIPLIAPTILVAFIIAFIFSLGELGTTIMLYPPGAEIMPIKVFTIMANAPQSLTSSMTFIVFTITLMIITLFYILTKELIKKHNHNND